MDKSLRIKVKTYSQIQLLKATGESVDDFINRLIEEHLKSEDKLGLYFNNLATFVGKETDRIIKVNRGIEKNLASYFSFFDKMKQVAGDENIEQNEYINSLLSENKTLKDENTRIQGELSKVETPPVVAPIENIPVPDKTFLTLALRDLEQFNDPANFEYSVDHQRRTYPEKIINKILSQLKYNLTNL